MLAWIKLILWVQEITFTYISSHFYPTKPQSSHIPVIVNAPSISPLENEQENEQQLNICWYNQLTKSITFADILLMIVFRCIISQGQNPTKDITDGQIIYKWIRTGDIFFCCCLHWWINFAVCKSSKGIAVVGEFPQHENCDKDPCSWIEWWLWILRTVKYKMGYKRQ